MAECVLFVTPPWQRIYSPSLALGMLKGALSREGIASEVIHLNLKLAERIGVTLYDKISAARFQEGERLFSPYVFSAETLHEMPGYRARTWLDRLPDSLRQSFLSHEEYDFVHRAIFGFLEECLETIPWDDHDIIGFTSVFEQNLASVALAKRIKQRWPERVILMGGSNCSGEMGPALHRQFPWIDFVVVGEAEPIIAPLVRVIRAKGEVEPIRGVVYRKGQESCFTGTCPPVQDMNGLPLPNYQDYFHQLGKSALDFAPDLFFESSRGCWWGEKHLCTFCGLNQEGLAYRAKTAVRMLTELRHLLGTYPVLDLMAADNILPQQYFRDFIPMLAELASELDFRIFYECKSNLRKDQIAALLRANIVSVQVGIESFSDAVLTLMDKGASGIQQVQTLKWMAEHGMGIHYGILYAIPSERAEDYADMCAALPLFFHLPPPKYCVPMELNRFSPFFEQPERFQIKDIRPARFYQGIYPFPDEVVARLVYAFDYNYEDFRTPALEAQYRVLRRLVTEWQCNYRPNRLTYRATPGHVVIRDDRGDSERTIWLEGLEADLFLGCDKARPLEQLIEGHSLMASKTGIRGIVEALLQERLLYRDAKDRVIALATLER